MSHSSSPSNPDADLARLRTENLALQAQNLEFRRRLDLMRENMDLQKAKIITQILAWMDRGGGVERPDFTDSFRSMYGYHDGHTASMGQSRDTQDVNPLVASDMYYNHQEKGNECNNATSDARRMPSSTTYKLTASKSQPVNGPVISSEHSTQTSQSVIDHVTDGNENVTSSMRRYEKMASPSRRENMTSPSRRENMTSSSRHQSASPLRKPMSPRQLSPSRGLPTCSNNPMHFVMPTTVSTQTTPNKVSEPIAPKIVDITDSMEANKLNNKIVFDKDFNPMDVESGLSLKERRIIDRPIDSILGKPSMTLYQTYVYANTLRPKHRLIGEIAFQLERRILDYVFGKTRALGFGDAKIRRFYGYTLKNIEDKIREEAKGEGGVDAVTEAAMKHSLRYIKRILMPLNYDIDFHGDFAEKMVNHYGLLDSSPEKSTSDNFGLEDPRVLRVLLSKLIDEETVLKHMLIVLDSLCLMAHHDKRPLFLW